MTDIVLQVKENEAVTTSLIVAEKFNKNHKDVLRKIETLGAQMEDGAILRSPLFFQKSEYVNAQNKKQSMYFINRDGFTLLAMGFTEKEALDWKLKYIAAFNEMEKKLHGLPDNRLEIARLIVNAPSDKVQSIRDLYPEYFSHTPAPNTLEYECDVNQAYKSWIRDANITIEWLSYFPTTEVYYSYLRYCNDNRLLSMGKKKFYELLSIDFGVAARQRADHKRYFVA